MAFSDIINQQVAKKILEASLRENRISHAYLFYGPEGSGKKLTALQFAKALNCIHRKDTEPCDKCPSCRRIDRYLHPDIVWLSSTGRRQLIGIESIKRIAYLATLKSIEAQYKVFIVEEPERLTKEAANSFLKTLEEPASGVVIILLSAFPYKIIPTIVSRCQKIKFLSLKASEAIEVVKKKFGIEEEMGRLAYFLSGGKIDSINVLLSANFWSLREEFFKLFERLPSGDYTVPLAMVDLITEKISSFRERIKGEKETTIQEFEKNLSSSELKAIKTFREAEVEDGVKKLVKIVFSMIKSCYTDILTIQNGGGFIINEDKQDLLTEKGKIFSSPSLFFAVEEIEKCRTLIEGNANLSLTLQTLFINLFFNERFH